MRTPTIEQTLTTLGGLIARPLFEGLMHEASQHMTNGHTNGSGRKARSTPALALPAPAETPRKKPGPKPKAKPEEKKTAPKAKAAPKPPKKLIATPKKAGSLNSKISEGRRAVASGALPKLPDRCAIVMGKDTLNAAGVIERLQKRDGWTPDATNLAGYISYTLSNNDAVFQRVDRGNYRVLNPKAYAEMDKTLGKAGRVASTEEDGASAQSAPAPAPAGDPTTSNESNETTLKGVGLGDDDDSAEVGANPFAAAPASN